MIFAELNRGEYYRTQAIPAFGLVLPGLDRRSRFPHVPGSHDYYANMVREVASGGLAPVFTDLTGTFFRRGDLTEVTGDGTPVIRFNFTSGDFTLGVRERRRGFRMQVRAVASGDPTRIEMWQPFNFEIVREV